jgi:hypothetical protein
VTYFQVPTVFPESHGLQSACFSSVASAIFAGNTPLEVRSLLWSTYGPSSYKWISQFVLRSENSFTVVSVHYTSGLLRDRSWIRYRYKTQLFHLLLQKNIFLGFVDNRINPLCLELNPICYLLALLTHDFVHVSRIRVKLLTLRLLMSYIYIYIYIWSTYS